MVIYGMAYDTYAYRLSSLVRVVIVTGVRTR
jgi:hypothetical protein